MAENTNKPQNPPDPLTPEENKGGTPTETPQGKKGKPPRYYRPRYSENGQKVEKKGRYSND